MKLGFAFKSQESRSFHSRPPCPVGRRWWARLSQRGDPGLPPISVCTVRSKNREAFVPKLECLYPLGRKELALDEGKTSNFPSPVLPSVDILAPKQEGVCCPSSPYPDALLSLCRWFHSHWDVTLATNLPARLINILPICNQYSLVLNHVFALLSCFSFFFT